MNNLTNCATMNRIAWNANTAKELFKLEHDGDLLVPGEIVNRRQYRTLINRCLRLGLISKKGKSILVCFCDELGYNTHRYVLTDKEAVHYITTGELPDFKDSKCVYGVYVMNRYTTNYSSYEEFKRAYLDEIMKVL